MRLHSNKYVEALLYITVPLAVHIVLTPRLMRRAFRQAKALVLGDPDRGYVVREIKSKTLIDSWCIYVPSADKNSHLLQQGIASHLATLFKLEASRSRVVYRLMEKPLEVLLLERKTKLMESSGADDVDDAATENSDDDDYYDEGPKEKSYEQLLRLSISASPAAETWTEVEPGVFFQYIVYGYGDTDDEEPPNDKEQKFVTMVFRFRSKRADASQAIDRLVKTALLNHQKKTILSDAMDTRRYMFVQTISEKAAPPADSGSDGGGDQNDDEPPKAIVTFKRYPLGEDKTFKNLFFSDKQRVLSLLDNFTQRRGKFAVKGFPYKLGLLLHGPPGTGKTSLIKAVAQHTKRHIVTISLAKIRTNQELMDAMFDLRFPVEGRELPIMLSFQDVVFVMEDIDCAGASVVEARASDENAVTSDEKEKDTEDGDKKTKTKAKSMASQTHDKLNLSGLLNVLDGVIDCPGRIVIMTTNHPEKLDPALVRPGRVNAQLMLGFMAAAQIQEMLEYYFSTKLTEKEHRRVEHCSAESKFTPAEIEEVCAEYDTVDEAIRSLERSQSG